MYVSVSVSECGYGYEFFVWDRSMPVRSTEVAAGSITEARSQLVTAGVEVVGSATQKLNNSDIKCMTAKKTMHTTCINGVSVAVLGSCRHKSTANVLLRRLKPFFVFFLFFFRPRGVKIF